MGDSNAFGRLPYTAFILFFHSEKAMMIAALVIFTVLAGAVSWYVSTH